jgi:hypothetical protein
LHDFRTQVRAFQFEKRHLAGNALGIGANHACAQIVPF